MIKLSEEGISKAEICWKPGLCLKENKCYSSEHMKIRKQNSIIGDTEKVLVVWIEDWTSHNIPSSQREI